MSFIDVLTEMGITPYDYTKIHKRPITPNYDLTYSMSEFNGVKALETLRHGGKVAVVCNLGNSRHPEHPSKLWGYPTTCGDVDDLRFLDRKRSRRRKGLVVTLKAKGDAQQDTTGFVIHQDNTGIDDNERHLFHMPRTGAYDLAAKKLELTAAFDWLKINDMMDEAMVNPNFHLFTRPNANPKTAKSIAAGYLTLILHLAPSKESRIINLCPCASHGCRAACLYTAGGVVYLPHKIKARIIKTWLWVKHRKWFLNKMMAEIERWNIYAIKHGLKLCVRPNGTSDIRWEKVNVS